MTDTWQKIHDAALTVHKDGGRELARLVIEADDVVDGLTVRAEAAEDNLAKLVKAITPSIKTKAAFMGEFFVPFSVATDWGEDTRLVPVPWTTVKEIMKSIRDFAELGEGDDAG